MTNARNILSALLVLLGAALLLAGAAAESGRVLVLARVAFAERGLEALEGDGVRGAIEEEIVDALTDRARSLGIVARRSEIRPIIEGSSHPRRSGATFARPRWSSTGCPSRRRVTLLALTSEPSPRCWRTSCSRTLPRSREWWPDGSTSSS